MKITIAGYGFVGQAYAAILQNYHELEMVDPKHYDRKISQDTEAVIVCVSTPEDNNGGCNIRHVAEVMRDCPEVPILIKSTVSPEGWDHLTGYYEKNMAFSPEFLRSGSALEDLRQQETIMLGGAHVDFWSTLFKQVFPNCPHIIEADPKELVLIKYFRNAYLATKVSFFNQVYDLCYASGINFEHVRKGIVLDRRIGASHSQVTKERGFGGHCLPKDTKAIKQSALHYGVDLGILREILNYNKTFENKKHEDKKD